MKIKTVTCSPPPHLIFRRENVSGVTDHKNDKDQQAISHRSRRKQYDYMPLMRQKKTSRGADLVARFLHFGTRSGTRVAQSLIALLVALQILIALRESKMALNRKPEFYFVVSRRNRTTLSGIGLWYQGPNYEGPNRSKKQVKSTYGIKQAESSRERADSPRRGPILRRNLDLIGSHRSPTT